MASKIRVITKRIFIYTTVAVVFIFLLSCLAPYLDPRKWWIISVLGFGFPILLVLVVLLLLSLLLLKTRWAILPAAALLLSFNNIRTTFSIHRHHTFTASRTPNTIRLVSWNVARFIEMKKNNNKGSQIRLKMMDMIRDQQADILCFQEFFHSEDSIYYQNINYIRDKFNYPYWYYSYEWDGDQYYTGTMIFSRFPILDSGLVRYPRPTLPDALMHADIKVGDDTIRVYTTHLQSLQFNKADYARIEKIKEAETGGIVQGSKTIFSKLKNGLVNRAIQADIVRQVMDDSPYPYLFCGDLNDIPNSYAYNTIRGDMQDAFLEKGSGIGRTFSSISPTLRIDYIFADSRFDVLQFNRIPKAYSDHYLIEADLRLKK